MAKVESKLARMAGVGLIEVDGISGVAPIGFEDGAEDAVFGFGERGVLIFEEAGEFGIGGFENL